MCSPTEGRFVACLMPGLWLTLTAVSIAGEASASSPSHIAVAWNDIQSGEGMLRVFTGETPWSFETPPLNIGADATLRVAGGMLYVVSRTAGMVTVIDPASWRTLHEFSVGAGREPVDIAVIAPQRAYVSCADETHLLRFNPTTGQANSVADLSTFADADGIPDMNKMAMHEGRLLIQLRRHNTKTNSFDWPPMLAVFDVANEQLIDTDETVEGLQAIELQGRAPKFKMQVIEESRRLYLGATGELFDEGGLEVVDLDTLQSLGLVIREIDGQVGADLGAFVLVTPERGFLSFSTDLGISSHAIPFTVDGGADPGTAVYETVGYQAPILAWDSRSDAWFFPDGGSIVPRVEVFGAAAGQHLGTVELPANAWPTDLAVIPAESVIVPTTSTAGAVALALCLLTVGYAMLSRRDAPAARQTTRHSL